MYKTIIASLVVIALSVVISSYLNTSQPTATKNKTREQFMIPTTIPTSIPTMTDIPKNNYQVESIDDVKNKQVKLILTSNGRKKVIETDKYWQMADLTIKPMFGDFLLSYDQKFLHYTHFTGYEAYFSLLYDVEKNKTINLRSTGDTKGFVSNDKYFYTCNEGGIMGGAAEIYQLPKMTPVYKSEGSYICEYDSIKNIIKIKEFLGEGKFNGKETSFDINTNTFSN